eukprot:11180950-Lingulodinium_polyedra.AAC.1
MLGTSGYSGQPTKGFPHQVALWTRIMQSIGAPVTLSMKSGFSASSDAVEGDAQGGRVFLASSTVVLLASICRSAGPPPQRWGLQPILGARCHQ